LNLRLLILTIIGAITGGFMVSFFAKIINVSIFDDIYYNPYLFQDTAQPFLWAIVITCVQPAIFEEVAFRGFLYTNLQTLTSSLNAVYVTAFMFGVLHLSFISLLWLVPIGLIFAWLRMKYNTLWYGIAGHFFYNFTIMVIEFQGW
jgi:uncharacterized protein